MKSIGLWATLALLVTVLSVGPAAAQNGGFVLETRNATVARTPGGGTFTQVRNRSGSFTTWKAPSDDGGGYYGSPVGYGGYYGGAGGYWGAQAPVWSAGRWYYPQPGQPPVFVNNRDGIVHRYGPPPDLGEPNGPIYGPAQTPAARDPYRYRDDRYRREAPTRESRTPVSNPNEPIPPMGR